MAKVLAVAALLALSLRCAEGGVVQVAINDAQEGEGAAKDRLEREQRQEKWRRVAAGKGVGSEQEGICQNINCPNSTICKEVNSMCKVCGFDQRCHSGSVCNHRCDSNDQCGGECPSCEDRRCKSAKKCNSYLCNYDWDCSDYPGDCSQCGKDGVCHTNSGICGVACGSDSDCGGDCQICQAGQCARSQGPREYPHSYPQEWPHSYPREYPRSYPQEYPHSYPQEYPRSNYPQEYPRSNYPQEYPRSNYPQEYPRSNYPQEYPRSNYPQEYPRSYPQEYPRSNYPQEYPANYPRSYPESYPREYPESNYPRSYPADIGAKAPEAPVAVSDVSKSATGVEKRAVEAAGSNQRSTEAGQKEGQKKE